MVLEFDNLVMAGNSLFRLFNQKPFFYLQLNKDIDIDETSTLDFSMVNGLTINGTQSENVITVGNVLYKRLFGIHGNDLHLKGKVQLGEDATEVEKIVSEVLITGNDVEVASTGQIESGFILLQANGTLSTKTGSKIESLRDNTCNEATSNSDLFSCVPRNSLKTHFAAEDFIESFNTQFGSNFTELEETIPILMNNYTIYLVSFNEMFLGGSVLQGSRIGFCAPNITLINSEIDTAGRGCPSDTGLGKGNLVANISCAGSGASHGGYGGYGGIEQADDGNVTHDAC